MDLGAAQCGRTVPFPTGVQQGEDPPLAAEHALVKEAHAVIADPHGGGGKLVDVFAVEQIALQLLFGNQVGTLPIEFRDQIDFTT